MLIVNKIKLMFIVTGRHGVFCVIQIFLAVVSTDQNVRNFSNCHTRLTNRL